MPAPLKNLTPDEYIETRVRQYQSWYDRKAVSCKRRYLWMRAFTVVAGGIVPVLVNVEPQVNSFVHYPIMRVAITIISLLVVVAVSLEAVFHYGEQWKNYRSTEQKLGHQQFEYLAGVGHYKGLRPEDAFEFFVESVEDTISTENAATLSVLAIGSATPSDRSK